MPLFTGELVVASLIACMPCCKALWSVGVLQFSSMTGSEECLAGKTIL